MKTHRPTILRLPIFGALAIVLAACHHVIIDGGLEPSESQYDEEWNLAFAAAIYPAKVDSADQCNGYFSQVETRQSFLNLVVATWTVGWISPMQVRLDCGAPAGPNAPDSEGAAGADGTTTATDETGEEHDHAR